MKKGNIILLAFISVIIISNFAAAALLEDIGTASYEFLKNIYLTPDTLSRLLLGLLLWIIINTIVGKIGLAGKGSSIASAAISLIMVVLAFIYLPANFVESAVLGYGAMGATILAVIPFVIIFYFAVTTESLFLSRIIWLFYMVNYLSLFFYKLATVSAWQETIPYIGAIIAGLIIFIFLPTIRKWIFKGEIEGLSEESRKAAERRKVLLEAERESLESFGGG